MEYIKSIQKAILINQHRKAFFIKDVFYTYRDLAVIITKIRVTLSKRTLKNDNLIGLIVNDDLSTYASILAIWLEGRAYIPINPDQPIERNVEIFKATKLKYVLDSNEDSFKGLQTLKYHEHNITEINLEYNSPNANHLAYILFTSGSTGTPKGVPISYKNVNAFINAIKEEGSYELKSTDKCLQMFELAFDFSVVSILFPWFVGACIYTVPRDSIKYFYIYKLITNHGLTVLSLVPSIIHYLKPYFNEIHAPEVRYCSFGGGALYSSILIEWMECIPNSVVFNGYGPTENTVYSSVYKITANCKTHNDVVSIGKPLPNNIYMIIDEQEKELKDGEIGELIISSPQLTKGYWDNSVINKEQFFNIEVAGIDRRFYKSGDLCFKNQEGYYFYIGRIDFQVKLRGFRVELSEVEYHAKQKAKDVQVVAIDILNAQGNAELFLVIESLPMDIMDILNYMKTKLPNYMIPTHIKFIKELPYNNNGKIDRNKLKTLFKP